MHKTSCMQSIEEILMRQVYAFNLSKQWKSWWDGYKEPSRLDFHCLQMYVRIDAMTEATWL